jgi:hypothetical protein
MLRHMRKLLVLVLLGSVAPVSAAQRESSVVAGRHSSSCPFAHARAEAARARAEAARSGPTTAVTDSAPAEWSLFGVGMRATFAP